MKFATCNCPVGMKYHALNCPVSPGQEQRVPKWALPPKLDRAAQTTGREPNG